jgi:dihydrolipoamide dehydrogenase
MKDYELVVIGAGPGGYTAALKAVQSKISTCLIEREAVGGICLNWGCMYSRTLMASARVLDTVKKGKDFGLHGVDFGRVKADWKALNERARGVSKRMVRGVENILDKSGVQVLKGSAEVLEAGRIRVGKEELKTENLIIATGSIYSLPDFLNDGAKKTSKSRLTFPIKVYTPRTISSFEKLPDNLVVIGGGVVGVEFSTLFSMLGVKVTLVEQGQTFMPYLDDDLRKAAREILSGRDIHTFEGHTAAGIEQGAILIKNGEQKRRVKADAVLFCGRRKASLDGLEALLSGGLAMRDGYIRTDLRARTSVPHVYAAGDVNGRFMLAHVASTEGLTAAETISGKGSDLVYDLMPYNMYSSPEIASVGMTEKQALERGFLVAKGMFPYAANGKALAEGSEEGFVKVVFDKLSGEIMGVHIIGENATDLIGEAVIMMQMESTVWDVARAVHPHPTLSEIILEAVYKSTDQPLEIL